MPDKKEVLEVDIRTKQNNPNQCTVAPDFVAKRGHKVIFKFPEFPDAKIKILGPSPFAEPELPIGGHKVRDDAATGPVKYVVTWTDGGSGNGTGEVIPV
jgi:hypothetical protein